jgi:hypothetical protein
MSCIPALSPQRYRPSVRRHSSATGVGGHFPPQVLVPERETDMAEMYRVICDELSHTPISTASRGWMVRRGGARM